MSYSALPSYNVTEKSYKPLAFDNKDANTTSPFISFLKKIWEAVKGFFKKIGDFFKKLFSSDKEKLTLNDREIEMIQSAKNYTPRPKTFPVLSKKSFSQVDGLIDPEIKLLKPKNSGNEVSLEALDLAEKAPVKNEAEPTIPVPKNGHEFPPITDPVMKEFHETAQEFVGTILNCIFEKKIEPQIPNMKRGLGNLSEGLKFAADLAVKIGDKAAKPLFEKLKKFSIDEKSEYQNLLNWLLKEGISEDFEEKLMKSLEKEFNSENDLRTFINPALQWLKAQNHTTPITEAFKQAGIEEKGNSENISKVYEAAMFLLLDQKINQFIAKCNEKLNGKLSQIVRDMMVENGKKVSDVLVHRVIDLFGSTQYSTMFNTLVKVGLDQTEAIIASEKAKENEIKAQKELLEKAKTAKAMKPKNAQEMNTKLDLLSHLGKVESEGEEKWIAKHAEAKAREAYVKFATEQGVVCHQKIAELMLNPNMGPVERRKIEEELFEDLAKEVIPLLLPKQKVELPDGTVKKVDGLLYLCSLIDIPKEFKEIAQEAVDISKEILTPTTQEIIKGIYGSVWEFAGDKIQESIVNELKNILKNGIVTGARTLFERFITPHLINEMVSSEILPKIQEQIMVTFGRDVITSDQKKFAAHFHQLTALNSDDREQRSRVLEEISREIYKGVEKTAKASNAELNALGYEKYKELIMPMLEGIENGIRSYQDVKQNTTLEAVKVALDGYFKEVNNGSNPQFGDLAINLLFKIGKFNGTAEFFSDFFKGVIAEQISSATNEISKSPHFIIEKATQEIKARYLDKTVVEELLFSEKIETSAERVDVELKNEIDKTAKVAHDLIFSKVAQLPWFKRQIVTPIAASMIGKDQKILADLISNVFGKVFGNRLMTHNVLVRCQEQILKFLNEGSKQLEAKGGMKPIKVEKMPTLIPDLFVA